MKGGKALIARADVIASLDLQMVEEVTDTLRSQVHDGDPGDRSAALRNDEGQEQSQRIAIGPVTLAGMTMVPEARCLPFGPADRQSMRTVLLWSTISLMPSTMIMDI